GGSPVGVFPTMVSSNPAQLFARLADLVAGALDSMTLNRTRVLRQKYHSGGDPRDPCSFAYKAGELIPFVSGLARLGYAAAAKALPYLVEDGGSALETAKN